jgi:hypothetical protein
MDRGPVDHAEAGVGVRRVQVLAAVIVVVLAIGGAAYPDRQLGTADFEDATTAPSAPSGAWYCPHGGGDQDWEVSLQIANPGPDVATVRTRTIGEDKPTAPVTQTIEPGSLATVPVDASGRERSSTVEWFGQWVAVGWITHAGGEAGGVAAEPCTTESTRTWLLPDATTASEDEKDYVVVMNPTARDAVISFTLLSERQQPVQKSELTDVVLKPYHSTAIPLFETVAGEDTVGTLVQAATGQVVASSLGISNLGGIRSTLGYAGNPPEDLVFPGGEDGGRSQLAVMSAGLDRVALTASLLGPEPDAEQAYAGVADAAPPSRSARTFATTTTGPASVAFEADGPGVAAVRRTFGVVSDQGSTIGGTPSSDWLVLPAVSGTPSHPGMALANPSDAAVEVSLSALGGSEPPTVVKIPARSSVLAPKVFMNAHPDDAVLATSSGAFVPAAVSYSRGKEGFATYAVALGIPVPAGWVPS